MFSQFSNGNSLHDVVVALELHHDKCYHPLIPQHYYKIFFLST